MASNEIPADNSTQRTQRPKFIYAHGSEPDPRFTLANERTFLAWIRTGLAFIAGGIALNAFTLDMAVDTRKAIFDSRSRHWLNYFTLGLDFLGSRRTLHA